MSTTFSEVREHPDRAFALAAISIPIPQIARLVQINRLDKVTSEVVHAAREILVVSGNLSWRGTHADIDNAWDTGYSLTCEGTAEYFLFADARGSFCQGWCPSEG